MNLKELPATYIKDVEQIRNCWTCRLCDPQPMCLYGGPLMEAVRQYTEDHCDLGAGGDWMPIDNAPCPGWVEK